MASHGIDAPAPAISFAFEGGDADQQQLNFYDASRFQYAAARLIYTLEHFRQTGRVLERIHAKVQADYRVSSPRPGSWVLDVVLVNSLPLAQMLIQVPIDIMLAYVIDRLIPANKPRSIALEIERERTAQSREETRRLEIMAQSNAIALNALSRALDASQVHQDRLVQALEARSELQAARDRSLSLRAHNDELNDKIDDNMEARLMSRTRGQVVEMGKPLLRSAEDLVIGGANVRGNLAYINRRIVTELEGDIKDDVPSNIEGNIVGYQKETGWGKFRRPEIGKLISFVVPGGRKNDLNASVIDAMKKERSLISYYNIRDANGNV